MLIFCAITFEQFKIKKHVSPGNRASRPLSNNTKFVSLRLSFQVHSVKRSVVLKQ